MNNKLVIGLAIIIFAILIARAPQIRASNEAHNKYQCAVLGYKADCQTPLPEEDKLR